MTIQKISFIFTYTQRELITFLEITIKHGFLTNIIPEIQVQHYNKIITFSYDIYHMLDASLFLMIYTIC